MNTLRVFLMASFLVSGVASAAPNPRTAPVTVAHTAASQDQMQGIWYSLNVADDDEERVRVIASVARQYYFSPIQAEALIQVVFDGEARAELVHLYADRLTTVSGVKRLMTLVPEGRVRDNLASRLAGRSSGAL